MVTQGGPASTISHQLSAIWDEDNKIVVRGKKYIVSQNGPDKEDTISVPKSRQWYGTILKPERLYQLQAELFGAEALSRDGRAIAEDNGWFLVKHFKLHLHPKEPRNNDMKLDQLPPGISLHQIYSDFLGYLFKHTKVFVEKRMALGKQKWNKYSPTMEVVIAHPNGWGPLEQDFLRKAAVASGFVDWERASTQVQFVTEAEASIHYCMHHSSLSSKLQPGSTLAVCDAGGSTVDTTVYSVISSTPVLQLSEVKISDSIQAGGILVNMKFEEYLHTKLKTLGLSTDQVEEFTMTGVDDFENFAKRNFGNSDSDRPSINPNHASVRIANTGTYGTSQTKIHRGCLNIANKIIKKCFDASVNLIVSNVESQVREQNIQHILLVGGFGDSPYLHAEFETHFTSDSCEVVLSNDFTSKAVADGRSFGMACATAILPWMPEAEGRTVFIGPQGIPLTPGKWVQIIQKGVPTDAESTFRTTFHRSIMEDNPTSITLSTEILTYSGDDEPIWAEDPKGALNPGFEKLCTITAQLWDLEGAMEKKTGLTGIDYWDLAADICISFGTTELQAHLEWEKNGIKRKGPAVIVPGRPVDLGVH